MMNLDRPQTIQRVADELALLKLCTRVHEMSLERSRTANAAERVRLGL